MKFQIHLIKSGYRLELGVFKILYLNPKVESCAIEEERAGRVKEKPCSRRRRQTLNRILPVGHNHMAIHRFIEMV